MDTKKFPILNSQEYVSYEEVAKHENMCYVNHGQSVNALIYGGGLTWPELYAVLTDTKTEDMPYDAELKQDEYRDKVLEILPKDEFIIPVQWNCYGYYKVKAHNVEDAYNQAENLVDSIGTPISDYCDYVEGSMEVYDDCDSIEAANCLTNEYRKHGKLNLRLLNELV